MDSCGLNSGSSVSLVVSKCNPGKIFNAHIKKKKSISVSISMSLCKDIDILIHIYSIYKYLIVIHIYLNIDQEKLHTKK